MLQAAEEGGQLEQAWRRENWGQQKVDDRSVPATVGSWKPRCCQPQQEPQEPAVSCLKAWGLNLHSGCQTQWAELYWHQFTVQTWVTQAWAQVPV